MRILLRAMLLPVFILLCACGGGGSDSGQAGIWIDEVHYEAAWPEDLETVYSAELLDASNDPQIAPGGAPPYLEPVIYPPSDITRVAFGIEEQFLYLTFEFAGTVPTEPYYITAEGEIEAQWVTSQGVSINLDTDNSDLTGAGGEGVDGIDFFCGYTLIYGQSTHIYCNYGFPDGDIHHHQGQVIGELGAGGPGSNSVVARFPLSGIESYFPAGQQIEWSGWAEAESSSNGEILYHHFSFDPFPEHQYWWVPAS